MAPPGEEHHTPDRSGRHGAEPGHAGWRELVFWYPWVLPVLGLTLAVLGFRVFAAITEQVYEHSALLTLDRELLERIAVLRDPTTVAVFNIITYLGDGITLALVVLSVSVWLGFRARSWAPPLLMLLTSAGTATVVFLVKITIARPRPVPAPNALTEDSFAFPSGHSAHSAAVYLMLAFLLVQHSGVPRRRWYGVGGLAVLLVLVTGLSRLVLGVHSPSDVLAGWMLGTSLTLLLISLWTLSDRLAPLRGRLVERARLRRGRQHPPSTGADDTHHPPTG
ncbi:phosphatase PAP2 family protein [Actinopolyspora mortivallis]|uniref:PAP2 family protein n=1 Tax=Actinopolyspora mortivallis TaxID=33906 RepID=A0A2T0GU38_ACTMO|nr:phosphatase PAP2 family protein [Actinopolyspora mortivallis]PRW62638.1 PAP2 family protein [Actinopolyspora mortivallis]